MEKIEKLKFKKRVLTSTLGLTTLLSLTPISSEKVSASEFINYDINYNYDVLSDINHYCAVYNLKPELVVDIIKNRTYDFGDVAWGQYNMIGYKIYDNKKLALLEVIKDIHDNPKSYGYTKEEIKSNYIYESTNTPEMMVEEYASIYDIPSEIALAIMYSECGREMNSHNYLVNNNPAGIGPHMHFENKEVGIIYFIDMLKTKYGCNNESTNEFFDLVAKKYCNENKEHWVSMTNSFYNDIKEEKVLVKEKTSK